MPYFTDNSFNREREKLSSFRTLSSLEQRPILSIGWPLEGFSSPCSPPWRLGARRQGHPTAPVMQCVGRDRGRGGDACGGGGGGSGKGRTEDGGEDEDDDKVEVEVPG